jgi:hypothetical protein
MALANIGPKYIEKQKDLADSLKGRFDGKILLWTAIPNNNYTDSIYNCNCVIVDMANKYITLTTK